MKLSFHTKTAQKVCESYFKRVTRMTKELSTEDQQDILLEIESHIYESLQKSSSENEMDTLVSTLEKLGEPEAFLVEMVADRKVKEAARTANPLHLIQALRLNISKGISYVFFAILFLLTFCFTLLIPLKLIFPDNIGYFESSSGQFSFGYFSNIEGFTELLGWWFLPLVMIVVVFLYFSIVFSLRLRINRN